MSATRDLLVELFVEELPPKALKALSEAFAGEVANGLIKRRLKQRVPDWKAFASPRRLAVYLPDVAGRADDRADEVKVMPASVGLAAGEPTPALLKKLASLGADPSAVPSLIRRTEGKAEVLFLKRTVRGQT
ncbi:MAG: glycine--tRNA ligase subunit beta, partial [Caldimonas sp.]